MLFKKNIKLLKNTKVNYILYVRNSHHYCIEEISLLMVE